MEHSIAAPVVARSPRSGVQRLTHEFLHSGLKNARSCLFPLFIFARLALSQAVALPVARYDFLLGACLAMQALVLATGLETRDELKVITLFHLLGLARELFEVHVGSWSYPEAALIEVWDVPLYSGFMYASVASFMIQAWRAFGLRFLRWPLAWVVVPLGVLIYLNFFTNAVLPGSRFFLITAVLVVFGRSRVAFTPVSTERPSNPGRFRLRYRGRATHAHTRTTNERSFMVIIFSSYRNSQRSSDTRVHASSSCSER